MTTFLAVACVALALCGLWLLRLLHDAREERDKALQTKRRHLELYSAVSAICDDNQRALANMRNRAELAEAERDNALYERDQALDRLAALAIELEALGKDSQ